MHRADGKGVCEGSEMNDRICAVNFTRMPCLCQGGGPLRAFRRACLRARYAQDLRGTPENFECSATVVALELRSVLEVLDCAIGQSRSIRGSSVQAD